LGRKRDSKRNTKRNTKRKEILKLIRDYGSDVLKSDCFLSSKDQKQHFRSSLERHTERVAVNTLKICRIFKKLGIKADEKMAVRAALCHDLGLEGRKKRYSSSYESLRRHPAESVKIAKKIYPEMNEKMEQAILRHMWPLTLRMPKSSEGLAVLLADKMASVSDIISRR
jgi:HD superfamily phosphodiesterase